MIGIHTIKKIGKNDPWIWNALEEARQAEDDRSVEQRAKESIAFIAFRPFEKVNPNWVGEIGWHPIFNDGSGGAASDGVLYTSYPVIVFHFEGESSFHSSTILPTSCSLKEAVRWWLFDYHDKTKKVIFDAVLKSLLVRVMPHRMVAEKHEVYKFPASFNITQWN
jgi:hypothetical protein